MGAGLDLHAARKAWRILGGPGAAGSYADMQWDLAFGSLDRNEGREGGEGGDGWGRTFYFARGVVHRNFPKDI